MPGAQVSLIWSHENIGVSGHAVRNSTADTEGYLHLSQLGPGTHTLNISAAGYQRRSIEQDTGVEDEVRIELETPAASWATNH